MSKKLTFALLALFIALFMGLTHYTHNLESQIRRLSENLADLKIAQAIQALANDSLSSQLDTLKDSAENTLIEIDRLKEDSTAARDVSLKLSAEFMKVESDIASGLGRIQGLEGEATTRGDLYQSVINARRVYQQVSQATVRISDGQKTIGSGFIFDLQGHIVTGQHVIENREQVYVTLGDGRVFLAVRINTCIPSDVAVLTIDTNPGLEPAPQADSDRIRVGEPVATIGNPFDLAVTLTSGIVSQVNRYVDIKYDSQTRWLANLIQFDAPVNTGNSGCPLVNGSGEVIGMVIARVSPGEGDGIYYAVSANKVRRVAGSLIATGSFEYPWLGINLSDLPPRTALERNLKTANGAIVDKVVENGPARSARISPGDIITSIDGNPLKYAADIFSYLGEHKSPGQKARLGVIHGSDSPIEITVVIAKQP